MADLCESCGHPLPNSVPCYYCTHCGEPTRAGRSASAKLPKDKRTHRRVSDWQDKLKDDRRLT